MLLAYVGLLFFATDMPIGPTPEPVKAPHFPDRVHAMIWRNWNLVPAEDMARVLGTSEENVVNTGKAMGLPEQSAITSDLRQRSYITVIRRNWHLLPYEQMLDLLGWPEEELAFTLREDDFLWIKLGSLKPKCEPLRWAEPDDATRARQNEIAEITREYFPKGAGVAEEPLFGFVGELSAPFDAVPGDFALSKSSPRYCYSYFALYGDAFIDGAPDPFPDGYLARLSASGVNAVWLQGVLYKLAPFPWNPGLSEGYEERLKNLNKLVERVKSHGMGVYLYMNEPRSMPLSFYDSHPELKGAVENDIAALCSSDPGVQQYMASSIALICEAAPNLAGFFTISASENLTNCWSLGNGAACVRCSKRKPADVIAEVNALIQSGIEMADGGQKLIAWDWGWADDWAEAAIRRLHPQVAHMSVSEWSIPIQRGGVDSMVGEYSISTVGPGPRATKHWEIAKTRPRPLKTLAKIQANTTWECGAMPYIPAVQNVAKHVSNLRERDVDGVMFGWTLGGYPSPNLEVAGKLVGDRDLTIDAAMRQVASRRYGAENADAVVAAWVRCSEGFSEFPYNIGVVYSGPQQMGPSNLLWGESTGYTATMVCYPYDHLDGWRSVFPPDVFVSQFRKVADGFDDGVKILTGLMANTPEKFRAGLQQEIDVMDACAIHYRSCANQSRFVDLRNQFAKAETGARPAMIDEMESLLKGELNLAVRLHDIQTRESTIGYEASNHYFYVPIDLAEKVINCADLLNRWIPELRAKLAQ